MIIIVLDCIKNQNLSNIIFLLYSARRCLANSVQWFFIWQIVLKIFLFNFSLINCELYVRLSQDTQMSNLIDGERKEQDIDVYFEPLYRLIDIINKNSLECDVNSAINVFDSICMCIGIIKSDSSTITIIYTIFVFILLHLPIVL